MNNNMNGFNPNQPNPMGPTPDPMANNMGPTPDPMANNMGPAPDPMMNNMGPAPDPMMNNMGPAPDPMMNNMGPTPGPNGMMPNQPMPQNGMNPNMMNGNNIKQGQKFNPIFVIIPVVIVAIIVAVILLNGNSGYKKAINDYCKGMNNLDAEQLKKAIPEEMYDEIESVEAMFDYMKEYIEEEDIKWGISCSVKDDKEEIKGSELEELNESFQEYYDSDREITEAYKVKVDVTTVEDDDEDTEEQEMTVIKIDGKWYAIPE